MAQIKVEQPCADNERSPDNRQVLVIVPCGQKKIWDKQSETGPTTASKAYIGPLFTLNHSYARVFAGTWVILSAKYGFITPDFEISGPYNVTFNRRSTKPIDQSALRLQVKEMQLDQYEVVIGLGGGAYRDAITAAFADCHSQLVFPFVGLPIGKMMSAIKQAISSGEAGI